MARLIQLPGDGPMNEGERRVVERLVRDLPPEYGVIPNVEIDELNSQSYEFDVIVTAPHAVYVLETKDWNGEIAGDDREWLVNDASRRSPIPATARKARVLKSHLVNAEPALGRIWVEPAVVLAGQVFIRYLPPEVERRVYRLDPLIAFLMDPQAVGQQPAAIADLQERVERVISGQARRRTGPLVLGTYKVIEVLDQTDEEVVYRAQHTQIPGAPLVRLRVVTPSPYRLTPEQKAAREAEVLREVQALARMGSHPNLVPLRHYFQDESGRMVLVTDDVSGRTLRQRLQNGTPLTIQQRLDLLIDLCRALGHAHAHQVIHRHVEPANVLLDDQGSWRLVDFSLAKLLPGGGQTVWGPASTQDLDPRYLAPELTSPNIGLPSGATDLYSLGSIAYELFAGGPPFSNSDQAFAGMPSLPDDMPEGLRALLPTLLAGNPAQRPNDARVVLDALERLRPDERPRQPSGPKDRYDPGDVIDGRFEVRGRLGRGGFSHVYRVYRALEDREYALKVFNEQTPYERLKREIEILTRISHPNVVRAVWADQTRQGQWYLVTELVEGEPLDDYAEGKKRLAPDEAVGLIIQLLSALEHLHPQTARIAELRARMDQGEISEEEYREFQQLQDAGIVHRDIKPQNLMLTPEGHLVLIDFNIASRVGDRVQTMSGTPPYVPPMEPGVDRWDVSWDLFAAGVVLYELLCCEHPYEGGGARFDLRPRDPREFRPELSEPLAQFLIRACLPVRRERFDSAREMRDALEAIDPLIEPPAPPAAEDAALPPRLRDLLANHPPNVNPMVREFLALSSQARRSNAGTRGMDELADATYVPTRLDKELTESVLAGRHRLVIVTGNAGDGKTAFIQQVEAAAQRRGAETVATTENGSRLQYAGREIVTLYDGSQDEKDRSCDEVLLSFFAPFAVNAANDGAVRLCAINEGRMRDFLLVQRSVFGQFGVDIIAVLDDPGVAITNSDVVVVNLNLRSVTFGGDQSIFSQQLDRIVRGPFWGPCAACDYRTRCPIKHNVDTFRDSTSGPEANRRLRALVDLVRLRRRRHLTMRDVRSLLSHILFRDRACEEIPTIIEAGAKSLVDLAYFQGPGGRGLPPETELERGAALLSEIDVAFVANPNDDRALAIGAGPRRMSFPEREFTYLAELIAELRRHAGTGYDVDVSLARYAHEAARRQTYFERTDDDWMKMLPYRRLLEFQEALDPENGETRNRLRAEITQAVSMYEGVGDPSLAAEALWLSTSEVPGTDYHCYRRFPIEAFEIRVAETTSQYVEAQPDRLEFTHTPSRAVLNLDLDLLEVLERLREGYVPTYGEGRGFLVNLDLFKNRLLATPSRELIIAAGDRLLKVAPGFGVGMDRGAITLTEVSP